MFTAIKKHITLWCTLTAVLITTSTSLHAQVNNIGAFLRAGAEDATILTKAYLKPFPTGFGTGLNAGWNESATAKNTLGFSLQIRPSVALVPGSAQKFDISELDLNKIVVADGEDPVTPTIAGNDKQGPLLEIYENRNNQNRKLGEFNMPAGSGVSAIPAPIVQASIGLLKGTSLAVRFFPQTEIGDYGSFGVLGGAVKHNLNQWLPGGDFWPVDVSVMAGFNRIDIDGDLTLDPEGIRNPNDPSLVENPNPDFDDQQLTTTTNAFVFNALVGKSLPFISVYGGVGYQKASFDLEISGDYPVNTDVAGQTFYNVLTDPVSFGIDSESNVHMLGGFSLNLGLFAFYGEVTLADYFTANAGVGISFR
ncbi:DUF6588 family protein [Gracilimonas mengyeensis]|uniref:Outer membrane protein beta-barrel domain-containing protein n=1 Tax=Gracilimonas mengyeensis TaxID=1302730 RepID=A0A521EAF7_9BACT|nr:DUF6588 family protein [Gracilimonas mengyeensis]SMO80150.1 hypothetical protein SAMN06265219_11112 [Gracilimonas mengyeensis]